MLEQQPPVFFVNPAEQPAELCQKTRLLARTAPGDLARGHHTTVVDADRRDRCPHRIG